ncbi:hypothetical protein SeLEV6574_g05921 [Synchytrium endobioticum]|uniref:RING-type E3 ubiquitin transferase n=1 Tax=Synchytrium endobioticum TaxID=286115 RepID=A0A507CRL9_9FUNG|nr:hypothetical protein SeLEV6574_g05921 [Synchytrium endobioticum]
MAENVHCKADTIDDLIDPDYKCPVCFEWLADPVTLDCQHSICYGCLQQIQESAFCKGACPLCRHRALNFIRRHAKNPGGMINQKLAATINSTRAERQRSSSGTGVRVLRNRVINTAETSLPKKRKRNEADESGYNCDGRSATKRKAAVADKPISTNKALRAGEIFYEMLRRRH